MKFDLFFWQHDLFSYGSANKRKRKRRKGAMPDKGLMNFSHTKLIIKIMSVDHVNDEYKTVAYYM